MSCRLESETCLQAWLAADKQLGESSKAGKVKPLLKLMALIGTLSGGRSVTQVALAWLMAKGAP